VWRNRRHTLNVCSYRYQCCEVIAFFRTWITRIMHMTLNSPSWVVFVFAHRNDQYWNRVTHIFHNTKYTRNKVNTKHLECAVVFTSDVFQSHTEFSITFLRRSATRNVGQFSPVFNRFNRGTWNVARIPGTLKDEWRSALGLGHLSPREPAGRAPLLGTPKDMLSKALEMDICFHRGPACGEQGGTLLS
jgi:hypothetical protein